MPFFSRPRRHPPLLESLAMGAAGVAFVCVLRLLVFGPVAAIALGPRFAIGAAVWALGTSALAGAAGGIAYSVLGTAASHRTRPRRWVAGTGVALAGLGTALLLLPVGPFPAATLPTEPVPFLLTLLLSAPLLGALLAEHLFPAANVTERIYLTPAAVAQLSEEERRALEPDAPAPNPRERAN